MLRLTFDIYLFRILSSKKRIILFSIIPTTSELTSKDNSRKVSSSPFSIGITALSNLEYFPIEYSNRPNLDVKLSLNATISDSLNCVLICFFYCH